MRSLFTRALLLLLAWTCASHPSPAATLPGTPYDARLQALESTFTAERGDPPLAAGALVRIAELKPFVSDPAAVRDFLEQAANDVTLDERVRAVAQHELGDDEGASPLPQLLELLASRSHDAEALEARARLEHAYGVPQALADIESAARLAPLAERWLALAKWSSDPAVQFRALSAALACDPASVLARVRLADYYIGRGQLEKARDLLREAVALAPQDYVPRARLARLYVRSGAASAAQPELAALESGSPQPLWLHRELAEIYEQLGLLMQAERHARAPFAGDPEAFALLVRLAERRHDGAALLALYRDAAAQRPNDPIVLARFAALALDAGEFAGAEAALRHALTLRPKDAALHLQLAALLTRAGRPDTAESERARALELAPANDNDLDRPYLADVAGLVSMAQHHPLAVSTMLANVRVQRVAANGLDRRHVQQLIYIAGPQDARTYSARDVRYSPAAEELRIVRARIHKLDGSIVEAEAGGDTLIADAATAMYYDARNRALRFPGLEKGDVIELEYELRPNVSANPYGNYFGDLVTFGNELPQQMQKLVLVAPASLPLHVAAPGLNAAQITLSADDRVYTWTALNTPPLMSEPHAPLLAGDSPYVHVSTFGSWQELGRWYGELVRPQFAPDDALRQVIADIARANHTDEERIRAVHQFVLRNTHYVALEFGVYGYVPYPVTQTLVRRFGDCKDKASLMVALLRGLGIDADLALVRTRHMGTLAAEPASIAVFDHAIVYLPKYDLWLDGTADYAGSRELPIEDQGAMALTIALDGSAALRQVPRSSAADNVTRRTTTAELRDDGTIRFHGRALTRGEDAPGLRRDYELPERQRDSVRDRLAEVYPSVRIDGVSVQGTRDYEHDVTVDFDGTLDAFAGRRLVRLQVSWMPRHYVQSLAPLASRREALELPAPWTTAESVTLDLPRGAMAELPPDVRLEEPFAAATLHFAQVGRRLVIESNVEFRQTHIEAADYARFRRFCSDLERAFHREIKVALP